MMKVRLNSHQCKLLGAVYSGSFAGAAIGLSDKYFLGIMDEPFYWPVLGLAYIMVGCCFLLISYLLQKTKILIIEDNTCSNLKNNNEN